MQHHIFCSEFTKCDKGSFNKIAFFLSTKLNCIDGLNTQYSSYPEVISYMNDMAMMSMRWALSKNIFTAETFSAESGQKQTNETLVRVYEY